MDKVMIEQNYEQQLELWKYTLIITGASFEKEIETGMTKKQELYILWYECE